MGKRIKFIDGLRGVAALMVVCCHLFGAGVSARIPRLFILVDSGRYGVPVFFVISGFVICYSLRNTPITWSTSGRFILRRSLRLDPPYWSVIGATFLLGFAPLTFDRLGSHLVYCQAVSGFMHYWGVFWTLCIEVQFYLLFLLLRFASDRFRIPLPLIAAPLFAFSLLTVDGWPDVVQHPAGTFNSATWIGPHFASFYLGILACSHFVSPSQFARRSLYAAFSLTALRLVVHFNASLGFGLATGLLIHYAAASGHIFTWLSGRVIQFLGRISYSLYLWHVLVYLVVHRFGGGAVSGFFASILVAAVSYFLIERPSIRLSKRIPLLVTSATELAEMPATTRGRR